MIQISSLIRLCSIVKINLSQGLWCASRKECHVSEPSPVWPASLIINLSCYLLHISFFFFFFFFAGVRRVSGINIYTSKELDVVNGTSVRLKCTFTSTHPVSLQFVSVSWNFRPLNLGQDESVCNINFNGWFWFWFFREGGSKKPWSVQ